MKIDNLKINQNQYVHFKNANKDLAIQLIVSGIAFLAIGLLTVGLLGHYYGLANNIPRCMSSVFIISGGILLGSEIIAGVIALAIFVCSKIDLDEFLLDDHKEIEELEKTITLDELTSSSPSIFTRDLTIDLGILTHTPHISNSHVLLILQHFKNAKVLHLTFYVDKNNMLPGHNECPNFSNLDRYFEKDEEYSSKFFYSFKRKKRLFMMF